MIPRPVLAAWRQIAPWRDDRQVAQDLILSVLAIRVANHALLGEHLVWRGGTCLHKLHLDRPRRYSEDLDYVLIGQARHGLIRDALREIVEALGMNCVREEVSQARVSVWGEVAVPVVGADVRVKFEINCADLPPLFDVARRSHEVATRVWNESANIPTFQSPELLGTKFRALAQRRKGRDLSDLWLARSEMAIADEDLASAADYYLSAADITPTQFRERLAQHVLDPEFRHDLDALTNTPYAGFDPAQAARELIQWTDLHLDPLRDQRRSRNAVRRDQQRWEREGWAPGNLRCPEYTMGDGNLRRCPRWVEPGEACPVHG